MPKNKNIGNFHKVLEVQKTYPINISSALLGSGDNWVNLSPFPTSCTRGY
ncbi:hypothetical protein BC751_2401 [Cecembia calidifontis]|uniref:Uncharacterized protein n=1 Tax=Cecembia calidifontis TaxID=1187080 RepID=A0A4Q7PAY8_9BACT|nr:hypothetical protein BC751_2401 [Cecembia calidifontis]